MALVLGLGNPGARYRRSRHNLGWRVLEMLVHRSAAVATEGAPRYREWRMLAGGREVSLVEPLTFMNASGEALAAWRERNAFEPSALLVVVDDVYLPLGSLRLRERGSSGGHQGLASIEQAVGSREYARLRVGIGVAESSAALREHVLEEFTDEERELVDETVSRAADAVECWLKEGVLSAMNKFNRRVPREVSES